MCVFKSKEGAWPLGTRELALFLQYLQMRFISMCVCLCLVFLCHMCVSARGGQGGDWVPLELELELVVSHLRSFVSALN